MDINQTISKEINQSTIYSRSVLQYFQSLILSTSSPQHLLDNFSSFSYCLEDVHCDMKLHQSQSSTFLNYFILSTVQQNPLIGPSLILILRSDPNHSDRRHLKVFKVIRCVYIPTSVSSEVGPSALRPLAWLMRHFHSDFSCY